MKIAYVDSDSKETLQEELLVSLEHCLLIMQVGLYNDNKIKLPKTNKWVRIIEAHLDYDEKHGGTGKLTLFVEELE